MNNTYQVNCTLGLNNTLNETKIYAGGVNNIVNFSVIMPDGIHTYNITCIQGNDTTQNETTPTYTIWVDTINPIVAFSQGNNSDVTLNQSYQLNYTDNLLVWTFNISIDGVLAYNLSNVGVPFYSYNGSINGTDRTLGQHNISTTVCDGHTAKTIKDYAIDISKPNNIKFDNLEIKTKTISKSVHYTKKKDRYIWGWEYDTPKKKIVIELPQECIYIDNKAYKGWFICGNKWVDFESQDNYNVEVNGHIITITAEKETKYFNFNSVGDLNCITETYIWNNKANLNISAYYGVTGALITNFSIYVEGILNGNTTTGTYELKNLSETSYNITFYNPLYENKTITFTIDNTTEFYNFTVYGINSLNITIYDEVTGEVIDTATINVKFSNNITTWVNTTATGYLYLEGLTTGTYDVTFYNLNYSTRNYVITIGNLTHQNLDTFMTSADHSTIFVTYDSGSSASIENASFSIFKQIGGTWTLIEIKSSDISGRLRFYYDSIGNYMFNVFKDGYETKIFYLNPILFSEYDVVLEKTTIQDIFWDYSDVNILFSNTFKEGIKLFIFLISSPTGTLTSYGYNISYPSTSNVSLGINAMGEALTSVINITNPQINDRVRLDYYYISSIYGRRNFTAYMLIDSNYSDTNHTFMKNKDTTYGLGLIERLIIATLMVIFVVGICSLMGTAILGMILGMFVYGYFTTIGFLPAWAVYFCIVMGVLTISLGVKT